uniref:Uncharacterized protein n=1 Tax=Salix viminalis TaxID=40686 RepID=A0A6N2KKT7_SALVM
MTRSYILILFSRLLYLGANLLWQYKFVSQKKQTLFLFKSWYSSRWEIHLKVNNQGELRLQIAVIYCCPPRIPLPLSFTPICSSCGSSIYQLCSTIFFESFSLQKLQLICWANLLWHLESLLTPVIPFGQISFGIRKSLFNPPAHHHLVICCQCVYHSITEALILDSSLKRCQLNGVKI